MKHNEPPIDNRNRKGRNQDVDNLGCWILLIVGLGIGVYIFNQMYSLAVMYLERCGG